ncbi:hypothetical protein EJD97_018934 [Solanum chilense]|uniref:Uncharacterized protein n=1 Tax=Solanum chilense TaxID=4083 RepID=A0A6N2B2D5_SOLCI|nr:hypothetical protein EJD97_018934 [Solanum chilense]
MACHARRRPTVCAAKGPCWHVTPNVIRPCVLSEGNDGIKYPTLSDRVCCTRVMMTCHVDVVPPCVLLKGEYRIGMPNIIKPCVQSMGDDNMPRPTLSNRVCFPRVKLDVMPVVIRPCGEDGISCPPSSDHLCFPMAMMECHARRHPTVCATQGPCGNFTFDFI